MAEKSNQTNHCKGADEEASVVADGSKTQPGSDGLTTGETKPDKRSWPELEGLVAEEALKIIKEEMPMADVKIIPHGETVTRDLKPNQVHVFVDSSNNVVGAHHPNSGSKNKNTRIGWIN